MSKNSNKMVFIWAGERTENNQNVCFVLKKEIARGTLILYAVDFYQVFVNGEFCSYGPDRAPAAYARERKIELKDVREIEIKVSSYNVSNYACDRQLPFFAARVLDEQGESVAESTDFQAYRMSERLQNVPRYSFQRGFTEVYDYRNVERLPLENYVVETPRLLSATSVRYDYCALPFEKESEGTFGGFHEVREVWWQNSPMHQPKEGAFDVVEEVGKKTIGAFRATDYKLSFVAQGFLALDVEAEEDVTLYCVFDEYVKDGVWDFRRSACNDCVCYILPKGKRSLLSFEPYVMMHLKILTKGKATVKPSFRLLQNDEKFGVELRGDSELKALYDAALRCFRSNATDIYMDGGRERAGWLFDSRFTALSEEMLTGSSKIERAFLENFNFFDTPELPKGMVPDCFPAQHDSGEFIPTYAMWYVIQVGEYYRRTADRTIVDGAKEKAYALYEYFQRFKNEDGLLEDLESWVFVEWSICNTKEYTCGVNYPANMVYAEMLKTMGELYKDDALRKEADSVRATILRQSYTGSFFVDNATRENGSLRRRDDHISETCQYYALFLGYCPDAAFAERMKTEFGPFRSEESWKEIGRSNILPGHYLRFFWLCEIGENDRVVEELHKCLKHMYAYSGTLWEMDLPTDSLCHGFTSAAGVILVKALTGYKGLKDGKPVFGQGAKKKYGVEVDFRYGEYEKIVSV